MLEVHEAGYGRVEGGTLGAELGNDTAAGADTGPARPRTAGIVDTDTGEADAGGALGDRGADAAEKTATFGATQNFAGQQRAIALNFNINIVFQNQCDDV